MARWSSLAASAALVAATLAAPAAASPEPPTAPATESARIPSKTSMVTVVIRVKNCAGCTIQPQTEWRPTRAASLNHWSGPERVVRNGRVAFRVPRGATRGMSFSVTSDDEWGLNAVAFIAMRYAGRRPGEQVSPRQAANGKRAAACWAGARRERVVLRMRVNRFRTRGFDGEWQTAIRPHLQRGVRTVGTMAKTYRGAFGSQDSFVCGSWRPRTTGAPDHTARAFVRHFNAGRGRAARRFATAGVLEQMKEIRRLGLTFRRPTACTSVSDTGFTCAWPVFRGDTHVAAGWLDVDWSRARPRVVDAYWYE